MQKNLLWKTKAKSGSGNSYNYSIKTRVRDILNLWHKFATKEKLEGREVCRLIQEIRSEHLNIKKKDNKPDKSSLFVSDNYYNYEDLVSKNVFKDDELRLLRRS